MDEKQIRETETPTADEGNPSDRSDADTASDSATPLTDTLVELTGLWRRWIDLILKRAFLDARDQVSFVLTSVLVATIGVLLLIGSIVLFDILLYRWLTTALDSANWALFALALGHVALGGILIRFSIARMKEGGE